MTKRPLILITNDDGIDLPGLHAAAAALADLGDLLIMAPNSQRTGAGRGFPPVRDKAIYLTEIPLAQATITRPTLPMFLRPRPYNWLCWNWPSARLIYASAALTMAKISAPA